MARPAGIVIRPCTAAEEPLMAEIVNDAAAAYRGVIPADRCPEPYMPLSELREEIAAGVRFWGAEIDNGTGRELVGVMGVQDVDSADEAGLGDVTLIRHAYVRTAHRGKGIGGLLIEHLKGETARPMLMGTWAAAQWAVRFYQRHGFALATHAEKETLLRIYWNIPERQVETSVVLADQKAVDALRGAKAEKVSAAEVFDSIDAFWSPRVVGGLNGQLVKLVRLKGRFEWHKHTDEDEMFWVVEGSLTIRLRGREVRLGANEFFIIPRGVEHMPVCENECRVMLFEPAATKQYGD
jgi:mannose-6-phosphate isomerase-like protein (cupin superfamily)/GNAT superfamily N-acetyltransferase